MNYEKLTAGTTKTAIDTAKPSEKGEIITYLSRMGDVLEQIFERRTHSMRTLIDNGNAPAKRQPLIGHYGHLRKAYLEQFDPGLYTALLASEKLYEHCAEINEACRSRIDLIMPQLAGSAGATEKLKAADPMKWVGLMNACKAQAEEIVKWELIYI